MPHIRHYISAGVLVETFKPPDPEAQEEEVGRVLTWAEV
jgi:hypothetical protein